MNRAARDLARNLTRRLWAVQLALMLAIAVPAQGATTPPPAPPDQNAKVRELLELLNDPQVQAWVKSQAGSPGAAVAAQTDTGEEIEDRLLARFGQIREHLARLVTVIPQLPAQFARAYANLVRDSDGRSPLAILAYLAAFLLLGLGVEWLFLQTTARLRHRIDTIGNETAAQRLGAICAHFIYRLVSIGVYGIASLGVFLIFDWPPLLRQVLFQYLVALLQVRIAVAVFVFLLGPRMDGSAHETHLQVVPTSPAAAAFWRQRLTWAAAWFAFGRATVLCLVALGFEVEARRLVAYTLGLGLLAIALDIVWRRPAGGEAGTHRRRALAWLFSVYFVVIWLAWVSTAFALMWFLIVILVVPWFISGMQHSITHLMQPPGSHAVAPSVLDAVLKRGLRALIIVAGALFLIDRWNVDLVALTSGDTALIQLVRGAVSSVVIIILADFGWQLLRTAIDRKILEAPASADPSDELWQRQARLKTLLPIFRNLLMIVLLVIVGLMVLSSLGINIGPLIAGASVVGVAIGFGAQTLVRDIISGMFYLLDDAFRVGEYIQSGTFKGTVESFSLRSVKLRHHRGPVYTVPFGVLGAVQNMSRDWVIDKLSVGVTYDTDLGQVKKIMKEIGKKLLEDPELKPKILETLKMQGVEQFGDYAIQIRMKMMTKPGEQFVIRRRANAMIKQAFDANGIEFAFPTVQVAGGEASPAEAASAARQVLPKAAAQE